MPSPEDPQVFSAPFEPFSTTVIPNRMNRPLKVTVKFSEHEAVVCTVIIGGELSIKCGARPPTVILDDVDPLA